MAGLLGGEPLEGFGSVPLARVAHGGHERLGELGGAQLLLPQRLRAKRRGPGVGPRGAGRALRTRRRGTG